MTDACRCAWAQVNVQMKKYHDKEWGVPVHDDRTLFEFLILEGAQAGLSWQTILNRREGYRRAYKNFDVKKVANFTQKDFDRLIADEGIIRNKLKIRASITNAQNFIKIQDAYGSFDKYLWNFVQGKSIKNKFNAMSDVPVTTEVSDALSKDLKKRGFKFVGSTIMYAFMQATGMVNDHIVDCFRYSEI